jgi:hypothetical protein
LNVVEGIGRIDGEADEDNVRIWVRERSESIVIFLSGGIPQRQLDSFTIYYDIGDAVTDNYTQSVSREGRERAEIARKREFDGTTTN